jgi:large subunit ribosomal protein L21
MFAVLKTGGKQYKVAKGDVFTIEKLDAVAGESVKFADVLMLGGDTVTVGAPFIAGAAVVAEVVEQTRGPHTVHYVKRRRKHSSQRKKGHRQHLTAKPVKAAAAKPAKAAKAAEDKPAAKAAAKPAAKKPAKSAE